MDIEKLKKQANWSIVEKRPTWGTVTTAELSVILGVSITNLNQWKLRGKLPEPEPRKRGKGNKNRWRISVIRSWLEDRDAFDIDEEFMNTHLKGIFPTINHAKHYVKYHWYKLGVERVV